ncbi:MAG TPA: protein kinase [Gemmatimonadaceae bacterium]
MSSETTSNKSELAVSEERASLELFERLRAATLGEYDILGELGRGGMATVFLAHEISLDRKVAIKVMSPAMVHGLGMVERFKREARTAANLSHPNIIPIYSVREVDGLLFCVIKLVQGTALDLIMKELGQLPIPMVHGILAQVGGALGYAHRHGVVHRDIKPGNILIDDEGWAVVTDFGIAKVEESEVKVTSTGMAIGTPTYMSPEQATADAITGASDQYSLGIVAYEMLTGQVPFTGSSMMAIMYSHFHDEPPSIKLLRPDCPDQLCDAVMRMLRKAPDDRWPSMEDAVAAAGSRPLAPEDPTRTQLIALAKTGHTHRLIVQTTTPRSPIPKVGKRGRKSARALNRWLFGAGALGLVGAGFVAAKMMTGSATPAEDVPTSPPAVTSVGDSITPPPVPRIDSTPRNVTTDASRAAPRQPQNPPADAGARRSAAEPGTNAPVTEPGRGEVQRQESTAAIPPAQKRESTTAIPLVTPPPVSTSTANPQTPPTTARPAPDPAGEVTAVIQSYARALAAADLAAARRIYQGMPNEQREGLEAMWRAGGAMQPNWSVTNLVITGEVATANVTGSNVVVTGRGQTPTRVPVSLRARLERRNNEWRLVALIN